MSKQETIDQINAKIKELQAEVGKLKAEPETLVFKPEYGQEYELVGNNGVIFKRVWRDNQMDFDRLAVGNVLRVGTAKDSAKYYFMNSEYDYWLPWSGQPKPKVVPKGLQFWDFSLNRWRISYLQNTTDLHEGLPYRWKRSEQ